MVAIVVVSYRTGPVLEECLSALLSQPETADVTVVDNGNPPAVSRMLEALAKTTPRLRLCRPGRNLGFAAACNLGAEQTTAPVLAFVNPDLLMPPGTLAGFLRVLADHPGPCLLGGRLLDRHGNEQRGGRRETLTPWRAVVEAIRLDRLFPHHPYFRRFNLMDQPAPAGVAEVPAISGALMVVRREHFTELGGMDESLFLHIEDLDLCLRVLKAGGRILYCGDIPVRHHGGTSDACRAFVEWNKTKSTIRYFYKHFLGAYPSWALGVMSVLLWLRFAAVAAMALPRDAGRMLRHLMDAPQ